MQITTSAYYCPPNFNIVTKLDYFGPGPAIDWYKHINYRLETFRGQHQRARDSTKRWRKSMAGTGNAC